MWTPLRTRGMCLRDGDESTFVHAGVTDIPHTEDRALVGRAYRGEGTSAYFDWQRHKATPVSTEIDAFKYTPYVRPRDTVVDFGCGAGHMVARLNAARRIGIEPNPYARAEAAALGLEMATSA